MHDPFIRQALLYGISGTILAAIVIGVAYYRHQAKWRKLRMRGDALAKQRELSRLSRKRPRI